MKALDAMKYAIGIAGSALIWAFGKWDHALQTLIVFMTIDYMSGLVVAGIFKHSNKTKSGGLNSAVCFKGLIRKCMILCMVIIGNLLDKVTGSNFVRDAVVIAYIVNESISIIENAVAMGVPVPNAIKNAIDVLKEDVK